MTDPGPQEPISDLSDSSFVILGQGSLPSELNDDKLSMKQNSDSLANAKSIFSNFESIKSDLDDKTQNKWLDESSLSEEEIQKKLDELVKENYKLKETLSQNNLAIKSQLDTFFMWQQEVLKTHETHKQKFLETKDLILKLRGENSSLKKQLEESLPGGSVINDEIVYSQTNKKSDELIRLNEKVKRYEEMCDELTIINENLQIENQKLKEDLEVAKSKILILNNEIDSLERENTYLKQDNQNVNMNSLESLSLKSLPNSEVRMQISNLLKQLEEERDKVSKLKEKLKNTKLTEEKLTKSKLSTTEELSHYIDKINDMNASLDMQNQRFHSLQSWVSLAEENLKENKVSEGVSCNLICEFKELKSHLNQEENVSKKKQEYLEELQEHFKRLLKDYENLQLQLNSIKNNESDIDKYKENLSVQLIQLEARDKELKAKQEECDNLKETINALNLECDSLKETIKKLNLECEEVAVLRVQVQLYQNDFNDERAAREKLAGEKEELMEQIRFLQGKLEALESDDSIKNGSVKSPLESPGKKSKYMCPKCMFSFSDLRRCEEHIDECLNIHFYP